VGIRDVVTGDSVVGCVNEGLSVVGVGEVVGC